MTKSEKENVSSLNPPNFKFSGHETFPCRYAWLPKAYAAISKNPFVFSDEEEAMVLLGLGRNMVKALRFWMQAMSVVVPDSEGGYKASPLGDSLLSTKDGFDPFIEDIRTLWLLHWHLSTNVAEPLFAWDFLLNFWPHNELSRSAALTAFSKESLRVGRDLSEVTLAQHLDIFLHTYTPSRGRKGEIQEDNLDCPLVELELLRPTGERPVDASGRRETTYAFRRERKSEITPALFSYCLQDFWMQRRNNEKTVTFRDVAFSHGSPGQIFKLPEWDVRLRLEGIATESKGYFQYTESSAIQAVIRKDSPAPNFLRAIYSGEVK